MPERAGRLFFPLRKIFCTPFLSYAFADLRPGAEKQELAAGLMRCLPNAPHGIMDYLFVELMLWGRNREYQWFDLGMAPLAGLEQRQVFSLVPAWQRSLIHASAPRRRRGM
jgi:lysylphosphatidylglycerol synthetase-like protein (DUF2156 family)